jgi:hypothetical protein
MHEGESKELCPECQRHLLPVTLNESGDLGAILVLGITLMPVSFPVALVVSGLAVLTRTLPPPAQ